MQTFKKALFTLIAGSMLATSLVTAAAAAPVAADPPPECQAIVERLGQWQFSGRVCWNLHEAPAGFAGPVHLDGRLQHRGNHVAAVEAEGHLVGVVDRIGPNRWAVSDVTATLKTPDGTRTVAVVRTFHGMSLTEAIRDFVEGTVQILIALLLP